MTDLSDIVSAAFWRVNPPDADPVETREWLEAFEKAIGERPEVMECYLMTGDADYLLRVVVPDVPAFERFIVDFLTRVPGVGNIKSSFALKQVKYQTALPLPSPSYAGSGKNYKAPRARQRRRA